MHPNKALRKGLVAALTNAQITIPIGGVQRDVTVGEHPPTGGWIPETELPGIYCFVRSERISTDSFDSDQRDSLIDIVLQAKGGRSDVIDQVDDMQLAVEIALMADDTIGGLLHQLRPVGSEVFTNQGEVIFGARRVTFEGSLIALRADPSF